MKRSIASIALASLLLLGACSVPEGTTPVVPPIPVAILVPSNDLSARCVVGIIGTTAGVITAVGTAGVMAVLAWGPTLFFAGMTAEECWHDATQQYEQFQVRFTCDYVTGWTVSFSRFVEVADYVSRIGCATPISNIEAGGGGGGGGGW